jgi:amino acid permease
MDILVGVPHAKISLYGVNWLVSRFAYAILAADEIVAVSNTVAFKYDDGRTYINWVVGGEVDAAVWIALFLVIVVAINMLPVKVMSTRSSPERNSYSFDI